MCGHRVESIYGDDGPVGEMPFVIRIYKVFVDSKSLRVQFS